MKRALIALGSLAALAGSGFGAYYFVIRPPYWQTNLPVGLGLFIGLAILSMVLLVWACSSNIYNIKAGVVIAHDFTAAHMTQTIVIPGSPATQYSPGTPPQVIPGHWEPDSWGLNLRDERGREGWLFFRTNVFEEYPVGSYYSPPPPQA